MMFAKVNGVSLHYQVIGAPAGKPVLVFVNALGTDFRIWRDVIVALAGDFAIVTYDKRGHGLSDVGTVPYTMADHVDDLAALLDHLGVGDVLVCGLSIGGMVAQGLCHARPDLVRGLILLGTSDRIGTTERWEARIAAVEEGGIASISGVALETWFTVPFRSPGNPAFSGYRNMLERAPQAGYLASCAALRDADYRAQTPAIAVPTLCLVGAEDTSTSPSQVADLASRIPGAEFFTIDGAAHIACVEQPTAIEQAIRRFAGALA